MNKKSVRGIGGEIWAEVLRRQRVQGDVLYALEPKIVDAFVDIAVGVLARHVGAQLENDTDLPVDPLPPIDAKYS